MSEFIIGLLVGLMLTTGIYELKAWYEKPKEGALKCEASLFPRKICIYKQEY